MHLDILLGVVLSYLFGSISSAIAVCKLMGLADPRTQGSKNPGATNVLRIGGKKAAIIALLGDTIKGVIPVLLAKFYGFNAMELNWIALAVFFGHLYPIYFRFQGGKGVATALGCLLALSWPTALCLLAIWLLTALLFRYSSLAALVAAVFAPVVLWFFTKTDYLWAGCIMSIFLIYRHKKNIWNLLQGQESKIGASAARQAPTLDKF